MTWAILAAIGSLGAGFILGFLTRRRRDHTLAPPVTVPHRSRVILKALPHPILIVDSDFRIEFANDAAVALALGTSDGKLRPSLREVVAKAIDRDASAESTVRLARRAGIETQLFVFAKALAGESRAVVAVFDADAPMASRIAQREFIVNVSHELKTPVGAIALMAETLEDAADDTDAVRAFAGRIRRESVRLAQLVDQLIELSRLQSSHTVITAVPTDLKACVLEAAEAVEETAALRKVEVDTSGVPHVMAACEPRSMTSAIRNLIDNAVRYSPEGRRVVVTAKSTADEIEVSVIDQGIGIDAADLPRVFERFFRADRARDRESGGTGIGLSIVKHVARQHGGRVDVWSEVGVGSTFTMVIPQQGR